MRRSAIRLCMLTATALAVCSAGNLAYGQGQTQQAPPAGGEAPAEPPAELPSTSTAQQEVAAAPTPTETVRPQGERWREILALPRRFILKAKRVELTPMYYFNFNNPLIRN